MTLNYGKVNLAVAVSRPSGRSSLEPRHGHIEWSVATWTSTGNKEGRAKNLTSHSDSIIILHSDCQHRYCHHG